MKRFNNDSEAQESETTMKEETEPVPCRKRAAKRGHKYKTTTNEKRLEIVNRVVEQGVSIRKVRMGC